MRPDVLRRSVGAAAVDLDSEVHVAVELADHRDADGSHGVRR
ncbi:MAG: hypothetical protein ACK559_00435 [bacterium]